LGFLDFQYKFVFGIAENMTNLLLKQGKNVIIDATNMTKELRFPWKNIALKNNAKVKVIRIFFR
jgi:predicted kinase